MERAWCGGGEWGSLLPEEVLELLALFFLGKVRKLWGFPGPGITVPKLLSLSWERQPPSTEVKNTANGKRGFSFLQGIIVRCLEDRNM